MNGRQWEGSDAERWGPSERFFERRAVAVAALIHASFLVVNSLSVTYDLTGLGRLHPAAEAWTWEGTSTLLSVALLPGVAALNRVWRWSWGTWRRWVPIYLLASGLYSFVHVGGMILLRKLIYPFVLGHPYAFARGGAVSIWDLVYEFRKDLLTFVLLCGIFQQSRYIARQAQALADARRGGDERGRLTLKSGGTTVCINARDVVWAKAAGNYVEIRCDGITHLVRMTLSRLQTELEGAGAATLQTHRSWLVNRQRVQKMVPAGDGNLTLHLDEGSRVPASRRYRAHLSTPDPRMRAQTPRS